MKIKQYISFLLLFFVIFISACVMTDPPPEPTKIRVGITYYIQNQDGFCFVCMYGSYSFGLVRIPCEEVPPGKLYKYANEKDEYTGEIYVKERQ